MFFFIVKDNNIYPWYILLDLYIAYRNASVLCQSDCGCLHKTVNIVVFYVKKWWKYLPKREVTHANVQSCPSKEKRELVSQQLCSSTTNNQLHWEYNVGYILHTKRSMIVATLQSAIMFISVYKMCRLYLLFNYFFS